MKSVIMALFLMSVSLGNFFTAGVNSFIQVPNQLAAATSLNTAIHAKDNNGKNLTQTDILKLASQTKDVNGNSIQYIPNQEGLYTLILAGKDGKYGTNNDIRLKFSKDGNQTAVKTAEDENLNTAFAIIKSHFESNQNTLPKTKEGTDLISGIIDNWGSPLSYRLVNRNRFRVTSPGADKNYMTENDIVLVSTISRPSQDDSAAKTPYSWREKRIIALMGDAGINKVEKGRGGIKKIEFDIATMVGGQTNLEGANYFWFFTYLMLGTAIVFIFVAFLYKPKEYLHEEM
jgi:POT family proton-dependent oligopeptide transporter